MRIWSKLSRRFCSRYETRYLRQCSWARTPKRWISAMSLWMCSVKDDHVEEIMIARQLTSNNCWLSEDDEVISLKKMSMWEKMGIPGGTDLEQCFTTWERWQSSDGRVPRKMSMGRKRECSMRLTLGVAGLGNAGVYEAIRSPQPACDIHPFKSMVLLLSWSIFCDAVRLKSFYITSTITNLY